MNNLSIRLAFPHLYEVILTLLALLAAVYAVEPTLSVSPVTLLATSCTNLTPGVATVLSGSSGTIRFTCGDDAAIIVARAGLAKPVFTLPTGYTALTIIDQGSGETTCIPGPALVSGAIFHFTQPGSFDYCTLYSNAPTNGLASFTLTWMKVVPKGDD